MTQPIDKSFNPSNHQLTTSAGNPVADNQNALSAGPRGPLLLQDDQLIVTKTLKLDLPSND